MKTLGLSKLEIGITISYNQRRQIPVVNVFLSCPYNQHQNSTKSFLETLSTTNNKWNLFIINIKIAQTLFRNMPNDKQ